MSKKKRIGTPAYLDNGFNEVASIAENYTTLFQDTVVALKNIEPDPNNPRKLSISYADVSHNRLEDLQLSGKASEEYEHLLELAENIKKHGLLHPVILYKHSEKYRLVAGERRTLACFLAGLTQIDARVFHQRPSELDLKLIQWAENMNRVGLTLKERLLNIRQIQDTLRQKIGEDTLTPTLLSQLLHISKSQASVYLSVLYGPDDVKQLVEADEIKNLDKAWLLTRITDEVQRRNAINSMLLGHSFPTVKAKKQPLDGSSSQETKTKGRPKTSVALGSTQFPSIVQYMVDAALQHEPLSNFKEEFSLVNWSNREECQRAFKRFIQILEREHAKCAM